MTDDTLMYTRMQKHLHQFQLKVTTTIGSTVQTPILNVFKKKNLSKIDQDQVESPPFEFDNPTRSKISCIRCRKFKKKCSRDFPECLNCQSSEELCKYIPRKSRSPQMYPIDSKTYTMRKSDSDKNSLRDRRIMPNDLNAILN